MAGQGEAGRGIGPDIQPRAVPGVQPAGKTRRRGCGIRGIARAELENDRAGQGCKVARPVRTVRTAGSARQVRRIENNEGGKPVRGIQRGPGDIAMGDADRPAGRLRAVGQPGGRFPHIRCAGRAAQDGDDIAFFGEKPRARLKDRVRHRRVRQQQQAGTRSAFGDKHIFARIFARMFARAAGSR